MSPRRVLHVCLAPVLGLAVLAGCGGDGDQQVATRDGEAADGRSVWAALADGATTDEDDDKVTTDDGEDGDDGDTGNEAGGNGATSTTTGSGHGGGGGGTNGAGGGSGGGGGGGGGGAPPTTPPTPPPTSPPPTPPPQPTVYRPTAIDNTGRTDVSGPMAAFFASVPNGATIEIPPGTYRMEQTLMLESRSNLVIRASGATFAMTSRGDLNRSNLRIRNGTNITVQSLTVRGANPSGGTGVYVPELAGQHGIDVDRSNRITLAGVTVTDTYGDLLYVGSHDGGRQTTDVTIRDCRVSRSGRQGIAITSARNVTVQGCTITDITRSTFDLEPGANSGHTVDGIRILGNRVERGRLLFVAGHGHGPVNNITIDGNVVVGQPLSIWARDLDGGVRRGWTITNNRSDFQAGNPHGAAIWMQRIDGLVLRGNHQVLQPGRNMYLARIDGGCNISASGNSYPGGVGEANVQGTC